VRQDRDDASQKIVCDNLLFCSKEERDHSLSRHFLEGMDSAKLELQVV
jgi:hypothetical protein